MKWTTLISGSTVKEVYMSSIPDDSTINESLASQTEPLADSSRTGASPYLDALLRGSGTISPTWGERSLMNEHNLPDSEKHEIFLHADVHNDDAGPPHTDGHIDTGKDPHDDGYIDKG
jgi:hypothetical protein